MTKSEIEFAERQREKLVKLVEYMDGDCPSSVSCYNCPHKDVGEGCSIQAKVDYLMNGGVTVQEWKPISEPPKEKGTYLVCTDNGGVLLGHWYGTAWNAGGGAKKHLAYWMEKPQPPKGE